MAGGGFVGEVDGVVNAPEPAPNEPVPNPEKPVNLPDEGVYIALSVCGPDRSNHWGD